MTTPEGKIKQLTKKLLGCYSGLYYNAPVPAGFGKSMLDFVICHRGRFAMVETKVPGKRLTPLQELCRDEVVAAGGVVFVISDVEGLQELEAWLDKL